MVTRSSSLFQQLVRHVLKWEGKTSSNPNDGAASCFPGGIHTNKGVTFCTFRSLARKLGITPVTHARFLQLTDREVQLFIYEFYKQYAQGLKPYLSIAAAETAWMSGEKWVNHHLREAARILNLPATTTAQAIRSLNTVSDKVAYDAFQRVRNRFITTISAYPRNATFANGWRNRLNDFNKKFKPVAFLPFFFSVASYLFCF